MITGADLRRFRQDKRVSLGQLAQMVGRDKGHLSRVETGTGRDVTPALIRDYERALGMSIMPDPAPGLSSTVSDGAPEPGPTDRTPGKRLATSSSSTPPSPVRHSAVWDADTLALLADLGSSFVGISRRTVLSAVAYTAAAQAVPDAAWWTKTARAATRRAVTEGKVVGKVDLDATREAVQFFSQLDQRHGGGHARSAVVHYLTSDVASLLAGRFANRSVRQGMFSAASELAYVAGWMAFDNGEHGRAQQNFTASVKLAADANDPAMAAHTIRAMAHQALDLGHADHGLALASASLEGARYREACARERALLGVVYARALAATGQATAAARALLRAEDDLAKADSKDDEPSRVFFFGEASLAHEIGRTLQDCGDSPGAERELRRSVRLRKAAAFKRTHAVTLGYLGQVQAHQGNIDEACATWSAGLEAMDGVHSARARQTVVSTRTVLGSYAAEGHKRAAELDQQVAFYLATTS